MTLLISVCPVNAAFADENTRPIVDAIDLGSSRCLKKKPLAKSVAGWLGHDAIDNALTISVADAPDGVRFVVKRNETVIGERTLAVDKLPCGDVRAAVGLGIASAIDVTLLGSLGVVAAPSSAVSSPAPPPSGPAAGAAADPLHSTPTSPPNGSPQVLGPGAPLPLNPWAPTPPPFFNSSAPQAFGNAPLGSPQPAFSTYTWSPGFGPNGSGPPYDTRFAVHRKRRAIPTWSLEVDLGLLIDVLPKVALGVSPTFEVTLLHWLDLRASLLATTSVSAALADPAGTSVATADAGLVAGRLDACAVAELGEVTRVRGCAGLLAGGVYAKGQGVANPRSSGGAWVSPAIRADVRWSLTKLLGLSLAVDGFLPAVRPTLQILDPTSRAVATRAFPVAGLGVSLGPSIAF